MKYNHPQHISALLPQLENLATYGVTKVVPNMLGWLEAVGIIDFVEDEQWMTASNSWVEDCLPAENELALIRNTALRDPLYRTHVDIIICSILHAVGKAERWKRLEELLTDKFRPFSLRFVQLIEWLAKKNKVSIRDLQEFHWLDTERQLCPDATSIFYDWDEELWGGTGRQPNVLFPLLEALYLPLCKKPVYLEKIGANLSEPASELLCDLIHSACQGEGLIISKNNSLHLENLWDMGMPIRSQYTMNGSGQNVAGLIGVVKFNIDGRRVTNNDLLEQPLPWGMPLSVKNDSRVLCSPGKTFADMNLFDHFEEKKKSFAFIGVEYDLTIWPEDDEKYTKEILELPSSALVPTKKIIDQIGQRRSKSPDVDTALANIGNHLYFGFLLQLFLLESLDRELGEESLILAPPMNEKLVNSEVETQVFYKPRAIDQVGEEKINPWSFSIGRFDEVLVTLAHATYINGVIYPYQMRWGPWSRGLHLFRTADIIIGLHDRWTLSPHVLDRLHGGGLMSGIIRKGRNLRDKLHEILFLMWTEKMREQTGSEKTSGNNN